MIDLLGLKSSQARGIIDPSLGVQAVYSDQSRIQMLIQKYLKTRGKAGKKPNRRETRKTVYGKENGSGGGSMKNNDGDLIQGLMLQGPNPLRRRESGISRIVS